MGTRYRLYLTAAEQEQLRHLISKRKSPAKQVVRAQLLMAIAENGLNRTDKEAAALYGTTTRSIERLRKCCCEDGLEAALAGKKREVFREKKLTGEVEAKLTMLACSAPVAGHVHWTLQLLAERMVELHYIDAISHTSVGTLLKKTNLSPGGRRCG